MADKIVLLDDGPDQTVYRLRARGDPTFVVENRTDRAWTVDLDDDIGKGTRDCGTGQADGRLVAAAATRLWDGTQLDEVPVTCTVPPHTTVQISDVGFVPRGALTVGFGRDDGAARIGRVVLFDFVPSP